MVIIYCELTEADYAELKRIGHDVNPTIGRVWCEGGPAQLCVLVKYDEPWSARWRYFIFKRIREDNALWNEIFTKNK